MHLGWFFFCDEKFVQMRSRDNVEGSGCDAGRERRRSRWREGIMRLAINGAHGSGTTRAIGFFANRWLGHLDRKREREGGRERGLEEKTYQLRVSGLMVLSLLRCFHQVRQLAFSKRIPFAMAFFCLVMLLHDLQTSSSRQSWER